MSSFPNIEDQVRMDEIHQAVTSFLATLKHRDAEAPIYWLLSPEDARSCVDRLVEIRPDTALPAVLSWVHENAVIFLGKRRINEKWFRSARDRLRAAADELDRLLGAPAP